MTNPTTASPQRVRWLVWSALIASVLVYCGIALSGLLRPAAPLAPQWLPAAFGAVR